MNELVVFFFTSMIRPNKKKLPSSVWSHLVRHEKSFLWSCSWNALVMFWTHRTWRNIFIVINEIWPIITRGSSSHSHCDLWTCFTCSLCSVFDRLNVNRTLSSVHVLCLHFFPFYSLESQFSIIILNYVFAPMFVPRKVSPETIKVGNLKPFSCRIYEIVF